jgi:hypothetical protein
MKAGFRHDAADKAARTEAEGPRSRLALRLLPRRDPRYRIFGRPLCHVERYSLVPGTVICLIDGQRGDLTAGLLYRGSKPPSARDTQAGDPTLAGPVVSLAAGKIVGRLCRGLPMRLIQNSLGWRSLDSAPLDEDVALLVTDGPSEPYPLKLPCRLTAAGW